MLTKVKLKNTEIKTINNDKNFKCICFIYSTIKVYFMSLILSILYPDKNSFADNSGNYRLVTVDKYRHPWSPDRNVNLEAYSCQYTLSSWNSSCKPKNFIQELDYEHDCIRPSVLGFKLCHHFLHLKPG